MPLSDGAGYRAQAERQQRASQEVFENGGEQLTQLELNMAAALHQAALLAALLDLGSEVRLLREALIVALRNLR